MAELRCNAKGSGRRDADELVQVSRELFQEQHHVPANWIVQECHRWDQQRLGFGSSTNECGCGPRYFGIEKATAATVQSERRTRRGLPQIQQSIDMDIQLKYGALDRHRAEHRILPLAEVACELCQCDAFVRSDIEGWISGLVPAIVSDSPGEACVQDIKRRVRRNVPNADAAPRSRESGELAQAGMPSYVAASSAKTRSISPRSMS